MYHLCCVGIIETVTLQSSLGSNPTHSLLSYLLLNLVLNPGWLPYVPTHGQNVSRVTPCVKFSTRDISFYFVFCGPDYRKVTLKKRNPITYFSTHLLRAPTLFWYDPTRVRPITSPTQLITLPKKKKGGRRSRSTSIFQNSSRLKIQEYMTWDCRLGTHRWWIWFSEIRW